MKPIHKWLIIGGLVASTFVILCCAGLIWGGKRMIENVVYPKAVNMPSVVSPEMPVLLSKLEAAMLKKAPKALAALGPGLKPTQIEELEKRYGVELSADLRQLYMWRNGAVDANEGAAIVPYYDFPALEEALKAREEFNKGMGGERDIFMGHQKTWVCIMGDDDTGGYFYDTARTEEEGSFFQTFRGDAEYTFFPSVRNFIAGVAECYEKGVYKEGAEGLDEEDDTSKAEDVWAKYGKGTGEKMDVGGTVEKMDVEVEK